MKIYIKCVGCGNKRIATQDELESRDHPMCELCFMPMIAEKVEVKLQGNKKSNRGQK